MRIPGALDAAALPRMALGSFCTGQGRGNLRRLNQMREEEGVALNVSCAIAWSSTTSRKEIEKHRHAVLQGYVGD